MTKKLSTIENLNFISPVDGDMLNEFDGRLVGKSLEIKVQVSAPREYNIKINNIPAKWVNGYYEALILLDGYRNTIEVIEENTGIGKSIIVYWLKGVAYNYRLSLDDNIWCLEDIAKNANNYNSIFDNPYLKLYKEAHDLYDTKVHINLFYQTDGFNLSQMPDKYKNEWKDNSDWLRLTFHSMEEFPDKPYIDATYDEIKQDYELITNEIIRFAGEELLSPVTTVHWGEVTLDAVRALRTMGIKGLVGYFEFDETDSPIVSYYLEDDKIISNLNKRDFWKDNQEDIIFAKHDIILDKIELEQIYPYLDKLKENPHKSSFVEMVIHEQYFYPHYYAYQPTYRDKVLTAAKWAMENGYESKFLEDIIFEK